MKSSTRNLTLTALFAALMPFSAFVRIPLGPVPLTLQSPMALIAGYCLGPRYGAAAMLLYLAVGLAGLPVFASGGGPAYVLSPTFGYIPGFALAALLTGYLSRLNRRESIPVAYILMMTGLAGIYVPGVLWLMLAMHWVAQTPPAVMTVLKAGLFVPFIGDIITTIPAALIAVRVRKTIRSRE
jgi:biotin transport system substrate-specific component